ncbi:UDP-Glycosyltransferase/glycogen phosphorylase [Tolypocladium paradoxum]|uniref:UDP-Glycosyltransferase/glycogen phosphorylase n=1 Tax=Tolypocladium paradoxum TaxID=94208 RepID=A0A2S4L848_9HYPO|nr:UDP-Glycosyltransferase/glycogen phosphorylase [Tolypocladium paradoxum]
MLRLPLGGVTLLVAIIAAIISQRSAHDPTPPITGCNNAVLFLTDSANGLSNVHVATSFVLLEHHPSVHIHYASLSWRPCASRPLRESRTRPRSLFSGTSLLSWIKCRRDADMGKRLWHGDGSWRLGSTGRCTATCLMFIKDDPAVVSPDAMFRPAMDAARNLDRTRAIVSPNALTDVPIGEQPWGAMFWKYPP